MNPPEHQWSILPAHKLKALVDSLYRERFKELSTGTLQADGSEQVAAYTDGFSSFKLCGYIDLSEMEAGDQTIIRYYVRIKEGGALKKYGEDGYSGVQPLPILYVVSRPSTYGVEISLEQTAGSFKNFDYQWFIEMGS